MAVAGSSGCELVYDLLGSVANLLGLDQQTACGLSYR